LRVLVGVSYGNGLTRANPTHHFVSIYARDYDDAGRVVEYGPLRCRRFSNSKEFSTDQMTEVRLPRRSTMTIRLAAGHAP
jgi:hypothetical protein